MRIKKLFFSMVLFCSGWVQAQTVWPAVQSNMYPYIPNMKLVRHEQTVLLGEGNQQTGIFYSMLGDTYSEQVSNELINDALLKSWTLHSLVRLGTLKLDTSFNYKNTIFLSDYVSNSRGVSANT
ncbi:MAG: hypothetical protein RLY60_1067, partial [Pseudomonadota bacterium]